ncbi:hypothetical protein CDD83_6414 [Cordyceps sp. RAO-2017]|nr:hypothetical protein CDD83_6414 [Cordyceps sp. RAO-2017]
MDLIPASSTTSSPLDECQSRCYPQRHLFRRSREARLQEDIQSFFERSDHRQALPSFDEAAGTRRSCLIAVILGATLALVCMTLAVYVLVTEGAMFLSLRLAILEQEILSLSLNLVLTFCIDGMMFVHSVSLRWALYYENRLQYNTNIRLLTSSRTSGPNRWYINMASLFFLILSYGTSSIMLPADPWENNWFSGPRICLNAIALSGLSVALAGQATIALWCLMLGRDLIPTWGSNPFNTALAAMEKGHITRRPGRCLLSVHQRYHQQDRKVYPTLKQGNMLQAQPVVRYILALVWALAVLALAWPITVMILCRALDDDDCWRFSFQWQGAVHCDKNFVNLNFRVSQGFVEYFGVKIMWFTISLLGLVFVCGVQALQTLGLHCVELLVNISRDEAAWRRAYSETRRQAPGLQISTDPLRAAILSWENAVLFFSKALLHWAIAQGMPISISKTLPDIPSEHPVGVDCVQFTIIYPRLFLYAVLALLLAAFATYLALKRPRGCQPATMGHLQTIADLIDDWETDEKGRMWWGDKTGASGTDTGSRYAGMSHDSTLLSAIRTDAVYC